MARLPEPGKDNGVWGDILNDFLSQALKADGTIKNNSVTADTIAPNTITANEIASGAITSAALSTTLQNRISATETGLSNKIDKDPRIINVKDYGAVGNGVADDTAAINAAISALVPGATLFFPPGRFMTSGGHVISQPSCIVRGSSGRAQTYNSSAQLYLRSSSNADMLTLAATQITVRDLTLYGNKTNQSAGSRGLVTDATATNNYFLLDAVWVDSFKGDGYVFQGLSGTLSGTIVNCESRVNDGYGMRFNGTSTDTIVDTCYIDQNGLSGVFCSAGDISFQSCHIWGNGTGASGDRDGMTFQSSAGCRVENCYVEDNHNGAGIRFKSGVNKGHIINGCDIWNNRNQGIYAFSASNCVISNNIIRTNNWGGSGSGAVGSGLVVDSCTALTITGNNFWSTGANRQLYGFWEEGTSNSAITFSGNTSRAVDHINGGVRLGPGTAADLGAVSRRKLVDQSVVSSTTLVNDTILTFPVVSGEAWELEGLLFVEGSNAGDIAVSCSAPSGFSGFWRALGSDATNSSTTNSGVVPVAEVFNHSIVMGTLAGSTVAIKVEGMLVVGTAGNFVIQWAQGTADATPTAVKAGSYLRARRVAQ